MASTPKKTRRLIRKAVKTEYPSIPELTAEIGQLRTETMQSIADLMTRVEKLEKQVEELSLRDE